MSSEPRGRATWVAALFGLLVAAALWPSGCAGAPACEKNSDCDEGVCRDSECHVECRVADLDCAPGETCVQGQCRAGQGGAGPSGPGAGGSSGGDGGAGPGPGAGGASSSTGSGGAATGGELSLCGTNADCGAPLSCQPMERSGTKRCTRACTSSAQCPANTRCLDPGGGSYCLGDDIGRACSAATQCNFACLTSNGYCTAPCSSGADCPNGYGCMPVGTPATNVCVRTEALCDGVTNGDCVAQAACDQGTASNPMILWGCTTACNSAADCPQRAAPLAPWTCDGLCRRPPDVYGPLPAGHQPTEWHCDGAQQPVVLCSDAQHIDFVGFTIPPTPAVNCSSQLTTAGAANDACVSSCRFQGGCTHGFDCVALGQVSGQRIGLCLPVGAKEPGQSCTSNTECAFGYCYNGSCSRDCSDDGICPGGTVCSDGAGPPIEGKPFKRCI